MTSHPKNLVRGFWRLADPRLTLASLSSLGLGTAAAAAAGPLNLTWLSITLIGIVCLEIAKNASGDIADYESGTDLAVAPEDRSPFSGGRRVLVDGLLTLPQTKAISGATYLLGVVSGLLIAIFCEPRVLALGIIGVLLAWGYGMKPLKLAYRGYGEVAVMLVYGPLICSGAYLVQRHTLTLAVVLVSIPLGLLIGGFLWINEFPDFKADTLANKRNWIVRLGRQRAAKVFTAILGSAFVTQAAFSWSGLAPRGAWFGLLALPFAAAAAVRANRSPNCTKRIILAQLWTLLCFVTLATAGSAGLYLLR